MGEFDGKVALVTGAAGGIGRAAADIFAARGARVVVADTNVAGGEETVGRIREGGGDAAFVAVDVADDASVARMLAFTTEHYGGLDCAFNNAGVSCPFLPFAEVTPEEWARVIGVNLTGVFLCMRHELPALAARGGGAIVNTSSGAGIVPAPGQPQYTAAKHGVLGLTKVAAQEHARAGIRVNAVLPGVTDTPMIRAFVAENPGVESMLRRASPTGEMGRPDQVAEAAVWLCSDRASYVNGESLVVDGGAICR